MCLNAIFPISLLAHGGVRGRKGVTRKGVKIFGIPRLVEFLDFGLHFRHEGAERALASYKGGKASL